MQSDTNFIIHSKAINKQVDSNYIKFFFNQIIFIKIDTKIAQW